jgi:hypothetical protein
LSFFSLLFFSLFFSYFWWYENALWREDWERIGMVGNELDHSLMKERDEGVCSLPKFQQIENKNSILEEEEDEEEDEDEILNHSTYSRQSGSLSRSSTDSTNGTNQSKSTGPLSSSSSSSSTTPPPLFPSRSLGCRVLVYLSANDDITPVSSIQSYLSHSIDIEEREWGKGKGMIQYKVYKNIGHAEAFFSKICREEIIKEIQAFPSQKEFQDRLMKQEKENNSTNNNNNSNLKYESTFPTEGESNNHLHQQT